MFMLLRVFSLLGLLFLTSSAFAAGIEVNSGYRNAFDLTISSNVVDNFKTSKHLYFDKLTVNGDMYILDVYAHN